ncbi:hypothetical protein GWN15_13095, partial [candidate division KSB1 bacterium]|nr:hypothetical protein [candidate division KSB1 bacterium]
MADAAWKEQRAIAQQIENIKNTNQRSETADLQEKAAKTLKIEQEYIQKLLENQSLASAGDP